MCYNTRGIFHKIEQELKVSPGETLTNVARRMGISRGTAQKAVYFVTGQSFRRLRESALLDAVREILAHEPEASLKEICFRIGFRSERSFRRFIRRLTGQSPTGLRNEMEDGTD